MTVSGHDCEVWTSQSRNKRLATNTLLCHYASNDQRNTKKPNDCWGGDRPYQQLLMRDKTLSPSRTSEVDKSSPKPESTDIIKEEALNRLFQSKSPLKPKPTFTSWPGRRSPWSNALSLGLAAGFTSTSQAEQTWSTDTTKEICWQGTT